MVRIGKALKTILLSLVLACVTQAKVLDAKASLSSQQANVGETIQVEVVVSVDGDSTDVPWPEVPLESGLQLIDKKRNESRSEQISIVNFKMTRRQTTEIHFAFFVRAERAGTFSIGPILQQGRSLGQGKIEVTNAPQDVRIATLIESRKVYVGQQIPFVWRLTADRPFEVRSFPDIRKALGNGFWSAMPDTQPNQMSVVNESGKQVGRLDLSGALFPLKPGRQILPSTTLDYRISERSGGDPFEAFMRGGDPFEAMFGRNRIRDGSARTQEIGLEVLPVPSANRPKDWHGAVGQYQIKSTVERDTLRAGDGVTLRIEMEGNGQPQAGGEPIWSPPAGVEAYPPQDTWTRQWKDGILQTALLRKIVLVPSLPGNVPLDSVRFDWFDPKKGTFQKISIPLPNLRISPAPKAAPAAGSAPAGTSSQPSLGRWDSFWILFGKISAGIFGALFLAGIVALLVRWTRARWSPKARKKRAIASLLARVDRHPPQDFAQAAHLRRLLVKAFAINFGEEAAGWTLQQLLSYGESLSPPWTTERAQSLTDLWVQLDLAEFARLSLAQEAKPTVRTWLKYLGERIV